MLKRPHLLLVTLLLVNAAAMEALPIFLDRLMSPTSAILLSVTAVLFFGAPSPQPPLLCSPCQQPIVLSVLLSSCML